MAADDEIENNDKLKMLEQFKKLIDKVKNIVDENIYDEKAEESDLWAD